MHSLVLVAGPRLRAAVPRVVALLVEEEDVELHAAALERQFEAVLRLQKTSTTSK